jgi:ATPase subunit of ABC transporter with duplicated ATPase domains
MSSQYIFTMHRLSKLHPPDKTVLNEITLAFYPGAKIGVLGYNGAGKSTLLRIMAGIDQEYRGEAALAPGATVGMLEQEPVLDESKDVKGNVEDGVAETKALLDRFNELAANYSDETADEFASIQAKIDAADAWNLDTQLEYAMDALRLPPPDADVSTLSGGERRRVALCRLLLRAPDLLLLDEPAAGLDLGARERLLDRLASLAGDPSVPPLVLVTHHLEEIPPGVTHAALMRGGRLVAAGRVGDVLTGEAVSSAFGVEVSVERRDGRWAARSRRSTSDC